MLNILRLKVVVATGCSLLLLGCASQPPQVSANVPLVSERPELSSQFFSNDVSQHIDTATPGDEIVSEEGIVQIQQSYISAMGLRCNRVLVKPQAQPVNESVICKSDQGWFAVNSLMPANSASLIFN